MSNLLITKDNLGFVLLLLLVVFLSQSKLLSFFAETKLGRGFVLIFIIFITYCNKSLGIISVLLVIIVFTYLSSGSLKIEGLDTMSKEGNTQKETKTKALPTAKEGFDMMGLEDVIRRGKMSNEMPKYTKEREIETDELSPFNELYASSMFSSI